MNENGSRSSWRKNGGPGALNPGKVPMETVASPEYWLREGIRVRVNGPGMGRAGRQFEFARPFARIGRFPSIDLTLDHTRVSRWHAYLHRLPEGIFFVDLGSREGTRLRGEAVGSGWLDGQSPLQIGPFELWVETPAAPPDSNPLEKISRDQDELLGVELSFRDPAERTFRRRLKRRITLIGRASPSNLRVVDSAIAHVHLALYRTESAIWLINLAGLGVYRGGRLLVAEEAAHGAEYQIGDVQMAVEFRRREEEDSSPELPTVETPSVVQAEDEAVVLREPPATPEEEGEVAKLRRELEVLRSELNHRSRQALPAQEELQRNRADARELEQLLNELETVRPAPAPRPEPAAAEELRRFRATLARVEADRDNLAARVDQLQHAMTNVDLVARLRNAGGANEAVADQLKKLFGKHRQQAESLLEEEVPDGVRARLKELLRQNEQLLTLAQTIAQEAATQEVQRQIEAEKSAFRNELRSHSRSLEEIQHRLAEFEDRRRLDAESWERRFVTAFSGLAPAMAGVATAPAPSPAVPPLAAEPVEEKGWLYNAPSMSDMMGKAVEAMGVNPDVHGPSVAESISPAVGRHLLVAETLLSRAQKAKEPWTLQQAFRLIGMVVVCVVAFLFFAIWAISALRQ